MPDAPATGQFSIDEILGQKVNPVEKQIFESRKSRMRLILGVFIWLVTTLLLALTVTALAGLLAVLL